MKKSCPACGKQIPAVALHCVFCGVKQPIDEPSPSQPASRHATDPTLIGVRVGADDASSSARDSSGSSAETRSAADPGEPLASQPERREKPTPQNGLRRVDPRGSRPARLARRPRFDDDRPWEGLGRALMAMGALTLLVLFFMPWHGGSAWRLLQTVSGVEFVRLAFYLAGGVILLAAAALPLPFTFRATVGVLVAATPVMAGASGVLSGWRGCVAGLALLALPATQLLRARAQSSVTARLLVLAAAAIVGLLYLLPTSSVIPITYVFKMITSGQMGLLVMGLFMLVPLVFAVLSVVGVMGAELADVGVLLSILILLWAPVLIALRGIFIEDATQVYVALALLVASTIAALSLAQLLSLAARTSTEPR